MLEMTALCGSWYIMNIMFETWYKNVLTYCILSYDFNPLWLVSTEDNKVFAFTITQKKLMWYKLLKLPCILQGQCNV